MVDRDTRDAVGEGSRNMQVVRSGVDACRDDVVCSDANTCPDVGYATSTYIFRSSCGPLFLSGGMEVHSLARL